MQLYKSRNFGMFFQDTFAFLRQNGIHLYKNFFIINGIFLMILMVMAYFFSKFYTEILFGGIIDNNPNAFEEYMNENAGLFFLLASVFVVVGLISSIISYAYIPIYFKLYAKNDDNNFTAVDIINEYKVHIGAILIFLLSGIVMAFLIVPIAGIISFILVITLIGFLLLPLVIGAVSLLYQGTLMEYLERDKGIWQSFGYSWTLMSSKFWPTVFCVGLFFLMSYIAQNVVAMIPYFAFIIDLVTGVDAETVSPDEINKSASVMMVAIFMLTFIVSTLLNIIVQVNQGIVFYSLKEDQENINTKNDIDLIGSGE
ncbi:MAG: hypothetical protein HRU26_07895 [Psychroserpens sp.]|nr:hypothetical protein [Psychroserpens sp.]